MVAGFARAVLGAAVVMGLGTVSAMATEKSEALAVCTINALTEEETEVLGTWLVMGMSSHPAMAESIAVPQSARDATNEQTAGILVSIWTERCAEERQVAYDEGGDEALNETQSLLNIHLVTSLLASPEVYESLLGVNAYFQ